MITIKCNCGTTEMIFKHMKESDFPKGWATDCCSEAAAKAPTIEVEDAPELSPEQDAVEEAEVQAFKSEEPEAKAPEEKPEDPKRRGRKPWKK